MVFDVIYKKLNFKKSLPTIDRGNPEALKNMKHLLDKLYLLFVYYPCLNDGTFIFERSIQFVLTGHGYL